MSSPRVSPDDVRALWRVLGVRYGFAVSSKAGDRIALAVGEWLAKAGIVSAGDWQTRFATFLPLPRELGGPTVYLPFAPGEATDQWPLEAQFLVGVHEPTHAFQYQRDPLGFLGLFLGSTADRANYEREARSAAECVRWALWGELADPVVSTSSLVTSYGCRLADASVAAEDLRLDEETIRAGGIVSPVASFAIDWWRRRHQDAPPVLEMLPVAAVPPP